MFDMLVRFVVGGSKKRKVYHKALNSMSSCDFLSWRKRVKDRGRVLISKTG
mgnify:CR=1 FL=1